MRHVIAAIFIIGFLGCTPSTPQSNEPIETNQVRMVQLRFEPKVIRVKAGTTVTWRNASSAVHNVVGDGFRGPILFDGQSWSHTFEKTGKFDYICESHAGMGMVGTVIVE